MKLEKLLTEKKVVIIKKWIDLILESYPADSHRFMKHQKDRFRNPVGATLSQGIENLYEAFIKGENEEAISPIIDEIVRIRAVQDFTPSKAIGFIFQLKRLIREELKKEILEQGLAKELEAVDSRIDDLVLIAFDVYMARKKLIYDIRAREAKNQVSRLLQKKGLMVELEKLDPHQNENNSK